MGLLVDGKWQDRWYDTKDSGGRFVRSQSQWRDWITRDGAPAPRPHARLQGGARPLSPLCLAGLPLGAPHADLSRAEEARGHHLRLGRASFHGRERLDVPGRGRRHRRHALRPRLPAPDLHQGRSRLFGPGDGAGAVGQAGADDRLQRVLRDHPHAQFGLRRMGRCLRSTSIREALARARSTRVNAMVYPAINNGVYRAGFATTQARL